MKTPVFLFLAAITAVHALTAAPAPEVWDVMSDTWGATDALGRALPGHDGVGDPKKDKRVAMFCFLSNDEPGKPVFDHTQMLATDPGMTLFPGLHTPQWWGEPWLGYYINSDRAVIRKHAQMLANAGVDVMVMDNTNGVTYPKARQAVCEVLAEMRAAGLKTPQLAFFSGHGSWKELQENFYGKDLYPDLWFRWQDKPLLLITHKEQVDPEVAANFSVRVSWAWTGPGGWFEDGRDKWPWLDHSPQKFGWHAAADQPEEISVAVAEHATTSIGRSYRQGKEPPADAARPAGGIYFDEQWQRALIVDPAMVFVTGWNEWTALNFAAKKDGVFAGRPLKAGESIFVDQYNEEFSRDIEPAHGVVGDNYYYQLIANVRRYKGVRAVPPLEARPIRVDGDFQDWAAVQPEYRDAMGDTMRRDSPGWGDNHYVNASGRNDFVAAKVSHDAENLYFYVRTKDPITSNANPGWMLLYLNTDADNKTGWLGYDFALNRTDVQSATTSLQRNIGGVYQWQDAARVAYAVKGNEMEIAIPFAALGLSGMPKELSFKWADNIWQTGDASDFTLNGDTAPDDRFYYTVKLP